MRRSFDQRKARLLIALAVLASGQLMALLPSCETAVTTLNPCGSIFGFCDPTDIDRMFGSVPDFNLDPSCTIPFYGVDNPQGGGGGGGGGAQLGVCATSPVYPFTPGPRPD